MKKMNDSIRLSLGRVLVLLKWVIFAGITGAVLGVVGAYFARSITFVTELRTNNPWILYLLPFLGLLIVFIYKFENKGGGTNLVLESVQKGETIPFRMAPMMVLPDVKVLHYSLAAVLHRQSVKYSSWMKKIQK